MANDSSSNIIKNTSLITLATLTSRVTGLVRTWAMAFALGNTVLASAYNIAYNMPAMIYELAATGILATAFLPLYLLQKEKNGDSGAQTFASNILTLTTIVLGLLALACSIFSAQVIETQTFAGGDPAAKEMAIFFFRVFAVQILLYGLGAVITGILNAERSYLAPSLAPVLNNLVVIVTMFGYVPLSSWNPSFAMWWLAVGTSLGVLVQFGAQIPALIKRGVRLRAYVNLRDPMLVEALKVAAPMFLYVAGTMITFSCKNAFALQATPNGPSTLNYAWMWYQLPYGVIAVSLGTTLLTELSDCAARDDWPGFRRFVSSGLRNTFFLMIPLAAMVCSLAFPLMQMFQAGAFSAEDTQSVGIILMFWTLHVYVSRLRCYAQVRPVRARGFCAALRAGLLLLVSLFWARGAGRYSRNGLLLLRCHVRSVLADRAQQGRLVWQQAYREHVREDARCEHHCWCGGVLRIARRACGIPAWRGSSYFRSGRDRVRLWHLGVGYRIRALQSVARSRVPAARLDLR